MQKEGEGGMEVTVRGEWEKEREGEERENKEVVQPFG